MPATTTNATVTNIDIAHFTVRVRPAPRSADPPGQLKWLVARQEPPADHADTEQHDRRNA
jgi:hypothetical protein